MRPVPVYRSYSSLLRDIPLPTALNGKTIELAFRTWTPQISASDVNGNGVSVDPQVGTAQAIARLCELSMDRYLLARGPGWLIALIAAGIGLFSFGLFILRRHATEYAWATVFLVCPAILAALEWCTHTLQWRNMTFHFATNGIASVMLIAWLLFIWRFVRIRPDRLLYSAVTVVLLFPVTGVAVWQSFITVADVNLVWAAAALALGILVLVRLARLAWRGSREAQLLLVPFLLWSAIDALEDAQEALYRFGWLRSPGFPVLYRGPIFTVFLDDIIYLLAYLSVGAVLVLRFTRSTERDERLSAEMEAAHAVQAQLVPAQLPATPYFRFEAAYFAAGEVGGDFYQVFPQADGTVLIAIGDVSGKGLKAAMLGTMVVGALCSLAQEDLSPSSILARLNEQLAAAAEGGFVTCLVLRIAPDGRAVLANAGHPAPYRRSEEIECAACLPLGVTKGAVYTETSFTLEPGVTVTLLSDGVVEARNAAGELFGFERARAISTQSAEQIAQAAQAFGQQDDITVLTLTRLAVGEQSTAALSTTTVAAQTLATA